MENFYSKEKASMTILYVGLKIKTIHHKSEIIILKIVQRVLKS
jgi:hypothetical protein